jgi:hypothetical protein
LPHAYPLRLWKTLAGLTGDCAFLQQAVDTGFAINTLSQLSTGCSLRLST